MPFLRPAPLLSALAVGLAVAGLATAGLATGASDDRHAPTPAADPPLHERLVLALLEPERIMSVDASTGATATLQLTAGTLCRSQLLVVDGRIVFLAPGRHGSRVMSVDVALRERPHWLARADVVVPSPRPGHVWIASRGPGPHGHWLVQDLAVRGGTIARPPRRAPSLAIAGAVSDGLVLQGGHGTFVWDPRTGRRLRATPGAFVLAAHGSLVVSCGRRCASLRLADGRHDRLVRAPSGTRFVPSGAALSPAGDRLAAQLVVGRRARLALVDTASGAMRVVPVAASAGIAFSPDGTRVYVVDPRDGRVRAHGLDGARGRTIVPRIPAPVPQLLAPPATPERAPVPRFAWLPDGWRQFAEEPVLPGAPTSGSVYATSWPYRPAPHGPAGALPAGEVLASAQLLVDPRLAAGPPRGTLLAPALVLPARPNSALEGRPEVPEYRIATICGRRRLEVRVDVAARRLDPARQAQVQRMLDALVLPPPPSGCLRGP